MILDEKDACLQIDFYSKPGCCLCADALEALQSLRTEFQLRIEQIDISTSPDLLQRYGNDIPVAMVGDRKLFKHRADPKKLRAALKSLRRR